MHSRRRRVGLAAALLAPSVAIPTAVSSPAHAADEPGGRIQLTSPQRMIDTRDGLGMQTDLQLPANGVLRITVLESAAAGRASLHPCGGAVDATSPLLAFRAGEIQTVTLTVGSAPTCLASTTPVSVVVDRLGSMSDAPAADGLQFVPTAPTIEETSRGTASGELTFKLSAPPPPDARGLVLEIGAVGLDAASYVTTYPCGQARPLSADVSIAANFGRSLTLTYTPLSAPGTSTVCYFLSRPAIVAIVLRGYLRASGPDPTKLPPIPHYEQRPVLAGLDAQSPLRILDTRDDGLKVDAGETIALDLAPFATPETTAAVLNVTATEPDAAGYVTVFPCDEAQPTASNLNYVAGQTVPNLVTAKLSADRKVCVYSKSATHLLVDITGTYDLGFGSMAIPIAPRRVLDTRAPVGVPAAGKIAGGSAVTLQVAGVNGVPVDATAVTMNVTVTEPAGAGYVTVYPCDGERPTASNLNYVAGQTVPNAVTVALSASGSVCLFSQSTTHLVADLSAWFVDGAGDGYHGVSPARLLDTRESVGVLASGKVAAGSVLAVQVAGRGGVPATKVDAVTMNVTVAEPDGPGFATVYPCDEARPEASNLNYVAGSTVPNLVTVKLSAAGTVCLYSQRSTHLVADVAGYLSLTGDLAWVPVLN
jgi:hypothetical protein